jgi:3-phenylpropionate/trans-cinnamate dioxygenase ferredoxin subunit
MTGKDEKAAKPPPKRFVVANAAEVPPGTSRCVDAGGRKIALFNVDGRFFALADKCPHEAGPLSKGALVGLSLADVPGSYRLERPGEFVRCPWHGWEFEIATGQSYCDPHGTRARSYDAKVEPGAALAKGPYVAETFPVSVEEDYVVIEV